MTDPTERLRSFGIAERYDAPRCETGYWLEGASEPFYRVSDEMLVRCEDREQLTEEIIRQLLQLRAHRGRADRGRWPVSTCCCPPRRDGTRSARCAEVNAAGDLRCRTERLITESVLASLSDPSDAADEPCEPEVIAELSVDVPGLLRALAEAGIYVRIGRVKKPST